MKLKGHDLYLQKYTCNELTKKLKRCIVPFNYQTAFISNFISTASKLSIKKKKAAKIEFNKTSFVGDKYRKIYFVLEK